MTASDIKQKAYPTEKSEYTKLLIAKMHNCFRTFQKLLPLNTNANIKSLHLHPKLCLNNNTINTSLLKKYFNCKIQMVQNIKWTLIVFLHGQSKACKSSHI